MPQVRDMACRYLGKNCERVNVAWQIATMSEATVA